MSNEAEVLSTDAGASMLAARVIRCRDWPLALARADLAAPARETYRRIIAGFFDECRRRRVAPTVASMRVFAAAHDEPQVRDALRWLLQLAVELGRAAVVIPVVDNKPCVTDVAVDEVLLRDVSFSHLGSA